MKPEDLAKDVADRVREAVAEAASRAEEIVDDAERRAEEVLSSAREEAERIRSAAEAEARERVDQARRALEELEGRLGTSETRWRAEAEVDPTPVTVPEPEPPRIPEPEPPREPEPQPPREPEPQPVPEVPEPEEPAANAGGRLSTEHLIAQLKGGVRESEVEDPRGREGARGADEGAAARLVAMKMALEGASRDEVDRQLADDYDLADREALLDDVFARVRD